MSCDARTPVTLRAPPCHAARASLVSLSEYIDLAERLFVYVIKELPDVVCCLIACIVTPGDLLLTLLQAGTQIGGALLLDLVLANEVAKIFALIIELTVCDAPGNPVAHSIGHGNGFSDHDRYLCYERKAYE